MSLFLKRKSTSSLSFSLEKTQEEGLLLHHIDMSGSSALSLPGEDELPVIRVHPTAVFGILTHFSRRSDLETRVIGTLLGTKNGKEIEITDCFGEPFMEEVDEIKIKINQEYHNQMFAAHRRISKKEELVGWYSTTAVNGAFITNTSSVINSYYAKQCDDERPVHLVVDSTLKGSNMAIRGFVAKPIALDDTTFADMFEEVKVEIMMSPAEKVAIYHMMLGNSDTGAENENGAGTVFQDWKDVKTVSELPNERNGVSNSVEQLLATIDDLRAYVDQVIAGKVAGRPEVGMELSNALNSLQTYNSEEISAQLQNKVQDFQMIAYLSTLTKAQLKISEKLHAVV